MAAASSSPLTPGYFLDRYELLCPLADGGMASVWVARLRGKHGFEKLLAIKTVLPQYAADPRFQQMFLEEARIAARIEHANVAQIVDVGEQHGITYLVMEWVDGDSLSRLYRALRKKGMTLPLHVLLRVVADACAGLHEAHEQGIVHRDVSPQNVLVSQRGVAKVIDFGIAKARDNTIGEAGTGLKGKIHYMAPEQALNRPLDRRADVFALGALLYHYISGAPPFDGDNQVAVLGRLTSGQPPAPLSPSVPQSVVAVVMRALSHDANARFASAHDLKDAIEAAMTASGLSCTQGQVAAFVLEHGASRTASRKEAIDLAISAAAERERVRDMLRPNPEKSATGVLAASDARFVHTSSFPPPPPLTPAPMPVLVPPSAPSGSIDVVMVAPTPRRGLAIVAVVLVVLGIVAGAVITFVVATHKDAASSSLGASSAPQPTTTAKVVATAAPKPTIDVVGVDIDSLPAAETSATATQTVVAPVHAAIAAPTETAAPQASSNRRSKYGF